MGSVALEGFGSGGAALNFKVVPGLTQPGTATENTIWVKTEKIGSWYFSATQPEGLQEWDVWFPTGTESDVEFNALKKRGVQVYPLSAKQMASGILIGVDVMSYLSGKWVAWWDGGLFVNGNQYESVTGGWSSDGCADPGYTVIAATVGQTIHLKASTGQLSISCTGNMVNLSGKEKLVVNLSQKTSGNLYIGITKNKTDIYDKDIAVLQVNTVGIHELTIPTNAGECYVYAGLWSNGDLQVSEIKAV